jgi:hypothetical protein
MQTPSGPSSRHSPPGLPRGGAGLAWGGATDGTGDGVADGGDEAGDDGPAEPDGSTPPGADQVPVGSGLGLAASPDGAVPFPGPFPGPVPVPAAAGDAARPPETEGWVPAGALAPLPGDRLPGACGPAGAATGGPAGCGVNRTVTVTKKA